MIVTETTPSKLPVLCVPQLGDAGLWRISVVTASALLTLLSLLCAIAWSLGQSEYLQLDSAFPPLHYNAALGFFLCVAGYLALLRDRLRLAKICAIGLSGLGSLAIFATLSQSCGALGEWLFPLPKHAKPGSPAGVPLLVSSFFVVVGVVIGLVARCKRSPVATVFGSVVGASYLLASLLLLFAMQKDSRDVSSDNAVLGVIGVAIAAFPLLFTLFRNGVPAGIRSHLLPTAVAVVGVTLSFVVWFSLRAEQQQRIQRQSQFEASHVQRIVVEQLPEQVKALSNLSENWNQYTAAQLPAATRTYMNGHPCVLHVAKVDSNVALSWVEASTTITQPELEGERELALLLKDSVAQGRPAVVRPKRSNWRTISVLVLFAPHTPKKPHGGLICVIWIEDMLRAVINATIASGYAIEVKDSSSTLFARDNSMPESERQWTQSLPITFRGQEWQLSVSPGADILDRESLSFPIVAFLVGLLATGLLVVAVHLAQSSMRKAAALAKEIRQRELAQNELQQSEQKYRTLIENLGQGIFLQDREHRYVAANGPFCRSVAKLEEQVIGITERELFDSETAARLAEEVQTVLTEGKSIETEAEVGTGETKLCVRRVLTPVRDSAGSVTGVLGICWDVTEQRKLEMHVHQASKMDAIGQLAGGIAHDFNNLLTVIIGNLDILAIDLPPEHQDRELAVSALSAATRAASLTQRLLGFSRRHQLDWRSTDVNTIVKEVVGLLTHTIDPRIRIEPRLHAEPWPVQADPSQLNQVLMNLCINARDAIEGAGTITIETACLTPDQLRKLQGPLDANTDYVRLRVTDTGSGIPPEVKARMYEPFFTTKDVGKGTGLGLAMVFSIVRQHKGWIDCQSEVGVGTTFDVYLPRAANETVADIESTPFVKRRDGKETILVVDDEELIRKIATATLERAGYRVVEAADGQEAVNVYSTMKNRIDLVILDLTMPVLSGHEAFRLLLDMNARVKVLFASGYAVEQLSELEKEMMAGFVKKPFRPHELLAAVAEAFTKKPSTKPGSRVAASPLPLETVAS